MAHNANRSGNLTRVCFQPLFAFIFIFLLSNDFSTAKAITLMMMVMAIMIYDCGNDGVFDEWFIFKLLCGFA